MTKMMTTIRVCPNDFDGTIALPGGKYEIERTQNKSEIYHFVKHRDMKGKRESQRNDQPDTGSRRREYISQHFDGDNRCTNYHNFDASYGKCDTYAYAPNASYCYMDYDYVLEQYAWEACFECGHCEYQCKYTADFNAGYGNCSTYGTY
eukprot:UN34914